MADVPAALRGVVRVVPGSAQSGRAGSSRMPAIVGVLRPAVLDKRRPAVV